MKSDSALVVSSGAAVKTRQGSNEHEQHCSLRRPAYNAACALHSVQTVFLKSNNNWPAYNAACADTFFLKVTVKGYKKHEQQPVQTICQFIRSTGNWLFQNAAKE